MAKFKEAAIGLNLNKPSNSSFFCYVNKLHITLSNPVGVIRQVTPMILMKLKGVSPSLINLDNRIDLETGEFKEIPVPPMAKPPVAPPPIVAPKVEEPVPVTGAKEEPVETEVLETEEVDEAEEVDGTEGTEEKKIKKRRKK